MELDDEFGQIYPIFSSGPHGYPSPTSQAIPTSTCPYSYPMTKVVEMIPGATAQSAGGREPQRPVDTAAHHCVGVREDGAGLSEMLEPHLEGSRSNREGTHKPSQTLEYHYLANKNSTWKSKLVLSNGPLEFENYRPTPWPIPFSVPAAVFTADVLLQAKLLFS